MPVISASPTLVSAPEVVYERLAFRCALTATVTESGVMAGTCAIHATKYRKLTDGENTYLDVLGLQGQNERGASLTFGQNAIDDTLISTIAGIASSYAGLTGDVILHFSWRVENGDIAGMVQLTIGDYSKGCGNSNELEATDPAFAQAFAGVIAAISAWCQVQGW